MITKRNEINMCEGSIVKNMIAYAIPVMITQMLQLFFNAADTVVVGRWGGPDCLAAVGATSTLTTLLVGLFSGLSLGAGVLISRCYGANDMYGLNRASHTSVSLSLLVSIIAMSVGEIFCKPILELMDTPPEIINLSVLYLRIVFLSIPAQLVYNFGASILRSVGDTKRPLYIITASGVINVIVNLILVIGFHLDVAGVAIATAVSHYISALTILYTLTHSDAPYKISFKKLKIHKDEAKDIMSIGIPTGIQSSVFALSNLVVQSKVNSFGPATIAGRSAGASLEGFVNTAMNSFQSATTTAVGQNYGAKKEKRIYKYLITGMICSSIAGIGLGLLVFIFGKQLLGLYIAKDAANYDKIIKEGMIYIIYCGLPYFICGIMNALSGTLRGMGLSKFSAFASVIGTCGFRIFWIFLILPFNHTTWFLYLCWPLSWSFVCIMLTIYFFAVRKKTMKKMYAQQIKVDA